MNRILATERTTIPYLRFGECACFCFYACYRLNVVRSQFIVCSFLKTSCIHVFSVSLGSLLWKLPSSVAVAHCWLHRSIRAWFTSLFDCHPVAWVGTSWELPVYSWHVLTIQTHAGLLIWPLWLARCECEYECVCWCLPAPVWQTGSRCTLGWAPASCDLEQAKRFRNGWMPDSVTSQRYLVREKQAFPQSGIPADQLL